MLSWLSPLSSAPFAGTTFLALAATIFVVRNISQIGIPNRQQSIRPAEERVLVIGASSGLGHTVAKRYAARNARVCIVARRAEQLSQLAKECGEKCFFVVADFSDAGAMVRVREEILARWDGLDTLCVCAGVSAVQPVMRLADIELGENDDASATGIQHAVDIAAAATQGNVYGPLVAALTFVPLLARTSTSPSILLVSSVAAVVPAPTRALYAATKASSLLLFSHSLSSIQT
ncbi:hypothetical protein F5Y06DRAFT_265298 [Hypoxylon sp. FL0890]|nr:hypothetical protein F5Y06DRAFT_265298 [Hypoxylon sp. FL0890]